MPSRCTKIKCLARSTDVPGELYCFQCSQFVSPPSEYLEETPKEYTERPDPNEYDGPEKTLVRGIVRALEQRGSVVFQVSQRGGKGSGTTVGTPDTFVSVAGNVGLFKAIEVKPKGKPIRPEQLEFVKRGASTVVRSVSRALEVCGYKE